MPLSLLIGLLSAAGVIGAALLGLVGVLWAASRNYKLGTRTAGTQETAAETARFAQLADENEKARAEVGKQWEVNRKLRQAIELADTQHESECEAWAAKEKSLLAKIDGLLGDVATLTGKLSQSNAEASLAIRGQERAEGGLQQARRTISLFSPSGPEFPLSGPEDHAADAT